MTSNLSNALVRRVGDASGIEAWRRIHKRYSPSAPATELIDLMRVVSAGKAQSHRELIPKIQEWQVLVDALHRDHASSCVRRCAWRRSSRCFSGASSTWRVKA